MKKQNNDSKCTLEEKAANCDVQSARRVTWLGFWVNAFLGVAKIVGGILGRSAALIADGIHSFSDFASDIIILTMVSIARKRPDKGHQFGHGRFEALATLLLSAILLIVGVGIFYDGLMRVIDVCNGEQLPRPEPIALVILVVSIAAKEWLFHITKRVGIRIHSEAVIANAWHHRSDSFSSIATLIGIAGAMFLGENWRILDPIAAMIVAIFIASVGIKMAKPALSEMLGASLPVSELDAIGNTLNHVNGVNSWHALRTFKSGNDAFIEVHLKMDPNLTVSQAHKIATNAEHRIKRDFPSMSVHVITHIEPDE